MIGQYDMIIIAVKPYQVMDIMREVHQTFKSAGSHTPKSLRPLVVSVAASVPLSALEKKVLQYKGFVSFIEPHPFTHRPKSPGILEIHRSLATCP